MTALAGWRGAVFTILLGAVAALAMPPVHLLPAMLSFSVLAWRLDRAGSWRAALAAGWLFGFGFHVAGLYWISNAMLVESERFAWAVPFAAAGLPALLAVYPAVAVAVMVRVVPPGPARALGLAAAWCVAEYARGHLLTGFPWNLPAYALTLSDATMQGASVFGAYGLSVLVMLAAAAPALAFGTGRPPSGLARAACAACLLLPVALWAGGALRLSASETRWDEATVIRLVQANIPQREKWKPELRARHLTRFVELSGAPAPTRRAETLPDDAMPTVVIWPETAVPALLDHSPNLRAAIARVAPAGGALVTGAPTRDDGPPRRVFNSLMALRPGGSVIDSYDKVHLVPFGEYLPFKDWIPFPAMVGGFTDFSPGPARRLMDIPGLGQVSPLICYEIIFPGAALPEDGTEARPRVLLNLTNDAWYGRSSGPYQHRDIARFRAVEEGLPLIRSANTGISGIYDAQGRVVVELALNEAGAIDAALPLPVPGATVFARVGDGIFYFLILALIFATIMTGKYQRTFQTNGDRGISG